MENPNRKRITLIAPLRPLCVPFGTEQRFTDEILDRSAKRVAAPWERLGLVYLAEYRAAPERPRSDILVNNLTQQIILRVFLTDRSRKPVEWDPAGFALLKKIFRRIVKAGGASFPSRDMANLRGAGYGALHAVLRSLLKQAEENERTERFSEMTAVKFKRTLTKVLRGLVGQPRAAIPPDIRITGRQKALLKSWTVGYADRIAKERAASESAARRYGEIKLRGIGNGGNSGNSEHMVMLLPPVQADGDRADHEPARSLPPIEYKRERQAVSPIPQRPRVINRRQTQTDTPAVTGRLENFSREEINRLADQIYTQIETRVLRERRRAGM